MSSPVRRLRFRLVLFFLLFEGNNPLLWGCDGAPIAAPLSSTPALARAGPSRPASTFRQNVVDRGTRRTYCCFPFTIFRNVPVGIRHLVFRSFPPPRDSGGSRTS